MERLVGSYVDEWKTATEDPNIRKKFKQFVNSVRGRFDSSRNR